MADFKQNLNVSKNMYFKSAHYQVSSKSCKRVWNFHSRRVGMAKVINKAYFVTCHCEHTKINKTILPL